STATGWVLTGSQPSDSCLVVPTSDCWSLPARLLLISRFSVRFRVGPLVTSIRRFFSARPPNLLLAPAALLGESRGLLLLDRRRVLRPAALGRDSPGRGYREQNPQYVPEIKLRAEHFGKAHLPADDLHDRAHRPVPHDLPLRERGPASAVECLLEHARSQRARHGIRQQRRIRPDDFGERGPELRRERPTVRHVQEIRHVDRLLIPEQLVLDHR